MKTCLVALSALVVTGCAAPFDYGSKAAYGPYGSPYPVEAPRTAVPRGDFAAVMLGEQNRARADFGSPPLSWDRNLEAHARAYAEQMARTRVFRHDPDPARRRAEGENIWMGTRGRFSYAQMIGSMIDERRFFRPGTFPNVSSSGNWADVGHYTQIVWPTTTRVGCAVASNERDDYMVCRYAPPGNIDGRTLAPRR